MLGTGLGAVSYLGEQPLTMSGYPRLDCSGPVGKPASFSVPGFPWWITTPFQPWGEQAWDLTICSKRKRGLLAPAAHCQRFLPPPHLLSRGRWWDVAATKG